MIAPLACALALVLGAWALLPWPAIPKNPQFPWFERWRAEHQRACLALRASTAPGPVLASFPSEVWLFAGFPAVLIPPHADGATLEALASRYAIRYLWLNPGAIDDSVLARLPVERLGDIESYRLYRLARAAHP